MCIQNILTLSFKIARCRIEHLRDKEFKNTAITTAAMATASQTSYVHQSKYYDDQGKGPMSRQGTILSKILE